MVYDVGVSEEIKFEKNLAPKSKNVFIADWNSEAKNHDNYFDSDGFHIFNNPQAQQAWAQTIKAAITEANKTDSQ